MADGHTTRLFLGDDRVRTLAPITGLDQTPVVSLADAVAKFGDEIQYKQVLLENALDFADDYLFMNGGKDEHGLVRDEIAAVNMYSMEGVYRKLNERLRDENRTALVKYWFFFLKLLLLALFKLPNFAGVVYRGVNPPFSIIADYPNKRKLKWWAFSSCTTDGAVITGNDLFLGAFGENRILFAVTVAHGKDIMKYSMFQKEAEIMIVPSSVIRVHNSMKLPDGSTLINVEEEGNPLAQLLGTSQPAPEPELKFAKKTYADGSVYEGEWKADKKEGRGKYTYAGKYTYGKYTYGDVYDGEWKADKQEGRGKLTLADGDVYEGEWKAGEKEGRGKLTWADGSIHHDGQWRDDEPVH